MIKKPLNDISSVFEKFNLLYGENTEEQQNRYRETFEKFKKMFNEDKAYICSSSGRVEVCGNHTDHNGGKVVCTSISLDTLAMFLPRDDGKIYVFSEGHKDFTIDIFGEIVEFKTGASSLVRGVIEGFKNKGFNVGGFNAYITSNVLSGAGISSSASFEVLIAEIENFLYNEGKVSEKDKAIISQFAEREFFGKPCGLLDQSAISFGGLNYMDFKNPENFEVKKINNSLSDYTLILVDTGGNHADLTDEYASIPNEMFSVAKAFNKNKLIEIDENEFYNGLSGLYNKLPDRAISRAIHFFNENKRVDKIYSALNNNNNFETFLKCIKNSGISSCIKLQNCFVAGRSEQPIIKALSICEEFLNDGANRVHGGGFAGCILNIVKNEFVGQFIENISRYFDKKCIIPLKVRQVGTIVL